MDWTRAGVVIVACFVGAAVGLLLDLPWWGASLTGIATLLLIWSGTALIRQSGQRAK